MRFILGFHDDPDAKPPPLPHQKKINKKNKQKEFGRYMLKPGGGLRNPCNPPLVRPCTHTHTRARIRTHTHTQ